MRVVGSSHSKILEFYFFDLYAASQSNSFGGKLDLGQSVRICSEGPPRFKNLETAETKMIYNLTCLCANVIVFMELIKLMSNLRGGEGKLGSLGRGDFKITVIHHQVVDSSCTSQTS